MWIKSKNKSLQGLLNVIDSEANSFPLRNKKAYTITFWPRYFTFCLEFGRFFELSETEISELSENYRRYLWYILPESFDINKAFNIVPEDTDLDKSLPMTASMSMRTTSEGTVKTIIDLHR